MNRSDFRTIAPAVREFPLLEMPRPTVTTLGNRCRMTVLENGDQHVNRLSISFEGGTIDSPNPAATSLMTQLLREGTPKMTGAEISEELDYNGAWLKIEPAGHYLTASLYSMNAVTPRLLPLLHDIIYAPTFPDNEIEALKEKMAAAAEINRRKVSFLSSQADKELTFGPTHPMTRQSPSAEEFRSVTRQDILDVWNLLIANSEPKIYLAGQTREIITPVNDIFAHKSFTEAYSPLKVVAPTPTTDRRKEITVNDALQCGVTMTIPTINRSHPDYIALRFAVMALGGYFGSRLMSTIREEKGYTYGINASLLGYLEGGFMTISTQTDPRYRDALIAETIAEIEKMRTQPMSTDELSIVRQYAMSSLASMLDSPFNIMDHYQNIDHNRISPDYFAQQQSALSQLTPERVVKLMNDYIDLDRLTIAIAGPA